MQFADSTKENVSRVNMHGGGAPAAMRCALRPSALRTPPNPLSQFAPGHISPSRTEEHSTKCQRRIGLHLYVLRLRRMRHRCLALSTVCISHYCDTGQSAHAAAAAAASQANGMMRKLGDNARYDATSRGWLACLLACLPDKPTHIRKRRGQYLRKPKSRRAGTGRSTRRSHDCLCSLRQAATNFKY